MKYFKIKCIVIDRVSVYHVIDTTTNVTHSNWRAYDKAMGVMRDLNRFARKEAKAVTLRVVH